MLLAGATAAALLLGHYAGFSGWPDLLHGGKSTRAGSASLPTGKGGGQGAGNSFFNLGPGGLPFAANGAAPGLPLPGVAPSTGTFVTNTGPGNTGGPGGGQGIGPGGGQGGQGGNGGGGGATTGPGAAGPGAPEGPITPGNPQPPSTGGGGGGGGQGPGTTPGGTPPPSSDGGDNGGGGGGGCDGGGQPTTFSAAEGSSFNAGDDSTFKSSDDSSSQDWSASTESSDATVVPDRPAEDPPALTDDVKSAIPEAADPAPTTVGADPTVDSGTVDTTADSTY